ncbi:hypothetical protein VTJ49DRAFT_5611 [Mycothermus thermophilus]|uniref:Queuine tRNA-ribosyltransferase accessory subunit 2 n=1 Tax=Humicola insolens TaxID=85995 RepID=A0ABR3V2X7_HUMIN
MTVDNQDSGSPAMRFEILKALKDGAAARVGRLAFAGRLPIDTPNFIAITSRGAVPHITPDNAEKHLKTTGAYMALEDFIERPQQYLKRTPPIYQASTTPKHPTRLHSFTATPPSVTTILSARRLPAVPAPMGNTTNAVSVFTSTGFQSLTTTEYHSAVEALRPDIAIPLADLTHTTTTPNSKRALRMAERTDEWTVEWFSALSNSNVSTFAPVLPIPYSIQWEYISRLAEDYLPTGQLAGLALYDADVLPDLESHSPSLLPLPRLAFTNPPTPHHILRQISLGIDLFTLPFLNQISDAGLALSFTFPAPPDSKDMPGPQPLAIDLSHPTHATSLLPLSPTTTNCACYACTSHHRAYIHHLLHAREMLGWTLLQIHNHAVISSFFAGVRATIAEGGADALEQATKRFATVYEADFPEGMAERPRARGYQFKSVGGGEGKRNKPAWGKLGGNEDGNGEGKTEERGGEEEDGIVKAVEEMAVEEKEGR